MKKLNSRTLIPAAIFALIGILCLIIPRQFAGFIVSAAGIIAALSAVPFLIHAFTMKRYLDAVAALLCALMAAVCFFFRDNGQSLISLIYGVYLTLIGVVFFIQAMLERFALKLLIPALLYFAAGIPIIIFHNSNGLAVQYVFGIYWLLQAFQLVHEYISFTNPYDARYWAFRHWMCLPAVFISIFPSFVIGYLQDRKLAGDHTGFDEVKNDKEVNMRIWVHTGTYGTTLYGHMTFSRNNIMYSYGDYDQAAETMFRTMGPGIFFSVDALIYANNCCIVEHCPLFEYGIHLTDEQIKKFDEMSNGILDQTVRWLCPYEQAVLDEPTPPPFEKYENVYCNRLWYRTCAMFRHYTSLPWSRYTLLGNNCSNFAAAKLNEIGLDLPISASIQSPGEYFDVLETLFRDPDSNVISRSWHSAVNPSTLFPGMD